MSKNKSRDNHEFPGVNYLPPGRLSKFVNLHLDFLENGRFIFTFPKDTIDGDEWLIYIDKGQYRSSISTLRKRAHHTQYEGEEIHPANEDLEILLDPKTNVNLSTWKGLSEQLTGIKLGVSNRELNRVGPSHIKDQCYFLNLFTSNFPFVKLFQQFKKEQQQSYSLVERGGHHLFSMMVHWVHTAKTLIPYLPIHIPVLDTAIWFPGIISFRNQLPSTQLTILIYKLISIVVFRVKGSSQLENYLQYALPEVEAFFSKHRAAIMSSLAAEGIVGTELFSYEETEADLQLREEFVAVVKKDLDYLLFQEALENQSGFGLKSELPSAVNNKFFLSHKIKETLWESISKFNILDRLDDYGVRSRLKDFPQLHPEFSSLLADATVHHLQKCEVDISSFSTAVYKLSSNILTPTISFVEKAWMDHLCGLCEQWMAPFLKFKHGEGFLLANWNLLRTKDGERLMSAFTRWKKQHEVNQVQLQNFINRMPAKTKSAAVRVNKKVNLPHELQTNPEARQIVAQHNRGFAVFKSYRQEKMMQFGILDDQQIAGASEELWLDELLKIEKEVSPYILFVKRAFQSALPVRKSVVFNHDRHATDGVEFDPRTIQNPEKWLRGEVMTTLKTKIKKGNAIQINAFALDASGSMGHEKMRNLFKILVLLVMGLEDRKSFDAFHFFSRNFIEAAVFSEKYTNRKLLFNILTRISQINEGAVTYSGDGGTNMSAGIKGCVNRISKFHQELKDSYPDTLFLKSLFVITDGEPSLGIIDPKLLNQEIQKTRNNEEIEVKGIYLKPEVSDGSISFMKEIFGKDQFVETDEFSAAINEFVYIMTQTYKKQRTDLRYKN